MATDAAPPQEDDLCVTRKISVATLSGMITRSSSPTLFVAGDDVSVLKGSGHRKKRKHHGRLGYGDESTASNSSASTSSSAQSTAETRSRRAEMAVAASHVWSLYMAGTPLFTRESLRTLGVQLDRSGVRTGASNTVVDVHGMDGKRVQIPTSCGEARDSGVHPDIVLVNTRPRIQYWTIEKLTGKAAWHTRQFTNAHALLPMRIAHTQEPRHRDADGKISTTGARSIADLASKLAATGVQLDSVTEEPHKRSSVDEVRKVFQKQQEWWEATDTCRELRATLKAGLTRRGHGQTIRKVVAFACSSMTEEREGGITRHAVQHAMVLTVRDVLEEMRKSGSDEERVKCIAQDPAYDEADMTVLSEAGIQVVNDPYGFLAVDENTIVISVAPSVPVRQIVADIARPAAMIWGRVVESQSSRLIDDLGGWDDPASTRVRAMVEENYDELKFPNDQMNFGTVDGMAIYVRSGSAVPTIPSLGRGTGGGLLYRLQRALLCQS